MKKERVPFSWGIEVSARMSVVPWKAEGEKYRNEGTVEHSQGRKEWKVTAKRARWTFRWYQLRTMAAVVSVVEVRMRKKKKSVVDSDSDGDGDCDGTDKVTLCAS
jgi:hypothetical protein